MYPYVVALAVLGLSSCINRTDTLEYVGQLQAATDAEHFRTVRVEPGTYVVAIAADVPVRLDVADEDAEDNERLCAAISTATQSVAASCTLTVGEATRLNITVHSTSCGQYELTVAAAGNPSTPVETGRFDLVGDCSDG